MTASSSSTASAHSSAPGATGATGKAGRTLFRINLAGGSAILLLTLAGYLFGVEPRMATRAGLQVKASTLEDKRREASVAETNARVDAAGASALRAQVAALPFHLEPPSVINQRLLAFSQTAEEHRIKIDAISPEKVDPSASANGGLYTIVPIKLTGSGEYATFYRFLRALRTRFPDTAITEFRLSGAPHSPTPAPSEPSGQESAPISSAATNTATVFSMTCAWYAAPPNGAGSGAPNGSPKPPPAAVGATAPTPPSAPSVTSGTADASPR